MGLVDYTARTVNGGLVTGLPANLIGTAESPDAENFDPADTLGVTTRAGSSLFGTSGASAGSGKGTGLFPWIRNAGTSYIFAAFGTTIYSVDSASWFSVQTGVATDSIMQGVSLNNLAVIVASGIAPKVSTAGSTLANLGGTPPSLAKYASIYVSKAWLAGDPVNPNKVSSSASNNPEDYTTANNASTITVGDGDGGIISGLQGTKRTLYVFKRNNTYAISGTSPFDFRVDRVAQIGLVSEYAVATDGQGCFFASDDGIYYANGLDIACVSAPIATEYKDNTDKTSIAMEVKGEKLFVYHKSSSSQTQNDKCWVLAYRRKMPDGGVRGIWSRYSTQPYGVAKTARDGVMYGLTNASTLSLYKLDTGTAASPAVYWNTPDMDMDDDYAQKALARYYVHAKAPNATTTLTMQWFVNGNTIGSSYSIDIGTTGSHQIIQAAPRSVNSIKGQYLRCKMSWTGQLTLYGFRCYADVHLAGDMPRT